MHGSGSGSCPKSGFVTGAVEPAGFFYEMRLLSPLVWCHVLKPNTVLDKIVG